MTEEYLGIAVTRQMKKATLDFVARIQTESCDLEPPPIGARLGCTLELWVLIHELLVLVCETALVLCSSAKATKVQPLVFTLHTKRVALEEDNHVGVRVKWSSLE